FDLVVVAGAGHSSGGAYGTRRLRDIFVRHLHGVEPPVLSDEPKPQEVPAPPKEKEVAVPDLGELIAQPPNAMRLVVQRYEADRGSLNRLYTVSASRSRQARMRRYYAGWLTALRELDREKLTAEGRTDYERLKERVEGELRDLAGQVKAQA